MRIFASWIPTVSAVTDFTTAGLIVGDNGNCAIGVTLSGSDVVGSISLQGAFTEDFARPFLIQTATSVTGSADTLYNLVDLNYPYVRLLWDYTSGTGNITIDASIRQQILNRG
jgi:hypothetical protein